MKNIFKKNSIIITALAIMIVIAGYLSFTNKDTEDMATLADSSGSGKEVMNEFEDEDGLDLAANPTGTDSKDKPSKAADANDETDPADATDASDQTDADLTDVDSNSTPADADNELSDGDISDEDILANAKDVADNGEINLEDGVPGEAVLANTADASYFIENKIEREQTRAKMKDNYMEVINSPDVAEKDKQEAIQSMLNLTDIMAKERAAEMLLEGKGFDGVVVFIVDDEASVVVNAASLTDQQLAIIEDVVKDKTDIAVENIEINPVVLNE